MGGVCTPCLYFQSEVNNMVKKIISLFVLIVLSTVVLGAGLAYAENENGPRSGCKNLPSWSDLSAALKTARAAANGGLNLDMWGTIVDRDGIVCAVAFTGANRGDQWP